MLVDLFALWILSVASAASVGIKDQRDFFSDVGDHYLVIDIAAADGICVEVVFCSLRVTDLQRAHSGAVNSPTGA